MLQTLLLLKIKYIQLNRVVSARTIQINQTVTEMSATNLLNVSMPLQDSLHSIDIFCPCTASDCKGTELEKRYIKELLYKRVTCLVNTQEGGLTKKTNVEAHTYQSFYYVHFYPSSLLFKLTGSSRTNTASTIKRGGMIPRTHESSEQFNPYAVHMVAKGLK